MAIYTVTISQKIFEQAKVEADTESEAIALVSENREAYDWELFYSTDLKIIEAKKQHFTEWYKGLNHESNR